MRFDLTDEQRMLRDAAYDFANQTFRADALAHAADDPADQVRVSAWKDLHELGLDSLLISADLGGSDGTVTDACIVAESLGRVTAPLPYVGSAIAAPAFLRAVSADRHLEAIASGQPACVMVDTHLNWPSATVEIGWDWLPGATGYLVDGPEGTSVELDDVTLVEPTYDQLHPLVRLDPIAVAPIRWTDSLRRALGIARVGTAAYILGLATAAMDDAVAYAKEREQYGRPIGSFQAVQHMCADMLVDVESMRSAVLGASWMVEHAPVDDAERLAASSLVWAGEAGIRVCETSIQVLGGIGVTVEHLAHRRLRSARHFDRAFGGSRSAALAVADQKLKNVEE